MKTLKFKPVIFLFVLTSFFGCEPEPVLTEDNIYSDVIFFVKNSSNCGLITINVDGFASRSITDQEYSSATPSCGDSDKGAVFRNLTAGSYNYSAFCDNNEVNGTFTIGESGCQSIFLDILDDDSTIDGGEDSSTLGRAAFWVDEDLGCGPIEVTIGVGSVGGVPIGGTTKTITSYFNQAPNCGDNGTATFSNLSPYNTYYYLAKCNGKEWTGTLSADYGECKRIKLTDNSSGGTTGDVKFWISEDLGCGNITVNLSGNGSSVITGYFNSEPSCDNANAGGNFDDLNPGNYSYTASCQGITWSGNINITANGCLQVQLTD